MLCNQGTWTRTFDAVVSATGNYSDPRMPDLQGMQSFPGAQMHSHSYRHREQFAGQSVLVLGASFSGQDSIDTCTPVSHEYSQALTISQLFMRCK